MESLCAFADALGIRLFARERDAFGAATERVGGKFRYRLAGICDGVLRTPDTVDAETLPHHRARRPAAAERGIAHRGTASPVVAFAGTRREDLQPACVRVLELR